MTKDSHIKHEGIDYIIKDIQTDLTTGTLHLTIIPTAVPEFITVSFTMDPWGDIFLTNKKDFIERLIKNYI